LGRALAGAAGWPALPAELRAQIADELNVGRLDQLASIGGDLVEYEVKPNFRDLGRRYGKNTPHVAAAIGAADPAHLVASMRASGWATVEGPELGKFNIGADSVIVTERPRTGWAVESAGAETIALDLTVTPDLRRAGIAREVIRLVQEARKADGLDVTDRIELWWRSDDADVAAALRAHGAEVAGEVLAVTLHDDPPAADLSADLPEHRGADLALTFWLRKSSPPGG
jgi:isoleucyl-tRNA synthetase